ncbi:MAG: type II toxin-antitoxin system RelE/ParE family toxin [Patescibacteria group bacterium]
MNVNFHTQFQKKYHKLTEKEHSKFKERLALMTTDEFNPPLNNHALHGRYLGYRSISITGDLRAIYKRIGHDTILFVDIGSHSNLYG